MAGTIVSDTVQDGSSNNCSTTQTIKGSATAWVNFTGSTGTINNSFNVASVTRVTTGQYTVTFTTAMANANYAIITSLKPTSGASSTNGKVANIRYDYTPTGSAFQIWTNSTGGAEDMDKVYVAVHSY
jgi:hypothetical protein